MSYDSFFERIAIPPIPEVQSRMEFWYSAGNQQSLEFIRDFSDIRRQLDSSLVFVPKVVVEKNRYSNDTD